MKWFRILYLALPVSVILCIMAAGPALTEKVNNAGNDDLLFLQEAFVSSTWKATLGRLAQTQAASADVKRYGERMYLDHDQYVQALKGLADRRGFSLVTVENKVNSNTLAFFSREYGAAFDRNFISLMMDDNQRDVSLYRNEAEKGRDSDIKSFAAGLVKKMEQYVRMAENILRELPQPVLK